MQITITNTHTNPALHNRSKFVSVIPWESSHAVFLSAPIIYFHSGKRVWLMLQCFCRRSPTVSLCHIHHNILVWSLVNESHFSLLWHLLPVSQTTYLYQMDQLPGAQKAHYWLTDLFILATSAGDSGPHQPALVSPGSGLGRHPNCSLKLPHSSRILQDASH